MREKTARIKVPESVIAKLYESKPDDESITTHVINILIREANKGSDEQNYNQTRCEQR